MSEEFWQNKIKAFLHDPPDKALILGTSESHEKHAAELWRLLGLEDDAKRLEEQRMNAFSDIHEADTIASAMQRVSLLKDFEIYYTREPKGALIKHTLSGEEDPTLGDGITTSGYEKLRIDKWEKAINFLKSIRRRDWKEIYFLIWRFLPEKYELGYFSPADTRIPDHNIWDHLDVTAAISSCLRGGLALFAVKLPAVQEFISHARKLADLWAGSHIYSTIIFAGIKTIIERYGPDVIIYPQLRGNPMVDIEEFNGNSRKIKLLEEDEDKEKVKKGLHIANFPNTFLCFIPFSEGEKISEDVEKAIMNKWKEIAKMAKEVLENNYNIKINSKLWDAQIQNAIEISTATVKFFDKKKFESFFASKDVWKDVYERQNKWIELAKSDVEKNPGHFYLISYEVLGAILAEKSRFWNAWEEEPKKEGRKCLMCGRRNALIENDEKKGYRCFDEKDEWEQISPNDRFKHLLRIGERLCAVCLVKRVYGFGTKSVFKEIFNIEPPKQESVVHIAAREFIENALARRDSDIKTILEMDVELVYRNEWKEKEIAKSISQEIKEKMEKLWEEKTEPNKYYAILMMDGDRIGKWLSGERWKEGEKEKGLPDLKAFLHPFLVNEISKYPESTQIFTTPRILTPSHHIAISRAMKDFSLYVVPKIVEKHKGFLVYAGGDDVLALFPADKVLDAACQIQEHFKKDFFEWDVDGKKRKLMGLGYKATMSAGIVFAHYNWPLYDAIERVREAVKIAKREIEKGGYGRNALCITFIKSSGEILTAGGRWEIIRALIPKDEKDGEELNIIKVLSPRDEKERKLSNRFIYDLIDIIRKLGGEGSKWDEESVAMLKSEIKRLIKRRNYKERLKKEDIEKIHGEFCDLIDNYRKEGIPLEDIGKLLKILYDAERGEE